MSLCMDKQSIGCMITEAESRMTTRDVAMLAVNKPGPLIEL